jgi:hypothetical protein
VAATGRDNLVVLLGVAALALVVDLLLQAPPPVVASVTMVNDTEFSVAVRVTDDGDGGWVSLTTVGDGSTSEVEDVLDQGDVWTFAFTAQGHDAGELTLTRAQLDRAAWTVAVPEAVADRLRSEGASASP